MKKLKKKLKYIFRIFYSLTIFLIISLNASSNEIIIEVKGNNFTDESVIFALIEKKPEIISEEYSNYLIKSLENSKLFEDISVKIIDNKYIISIKEYPNINTIFFDKNERFDDEELYEYSKELNLNNLNPIPINNFVNEITNLYQSFGYNEVNISYYEELLENNTADLYFEVAEGEITKINSINFEGNFNLDSQNLKSIIKSKTKTITNIFANNNFKRFVVQDDVRKLKKYYINKGYIDVDIGYNIEYLKSNRVNIYFNITEGPFYTFNKINLLDENKIISPELKEVIISLINNNIKKDEYYSKDKINNLKIEITDLILEDGFQYFELKTLEKKEKNSVSVIYNIFPIQPKYTNQINIYGNSRTLEKVIRRELEIAEGDPIYVSQIERMQKKLNSLRLFKSVEIVEKELEDNLIDIEINVEETQTGTFNAGVTFGTLDGVGLVAGLSEKNFYGTGRSLNALINTTDNKTQFTFETKNRILYENNVDLSYRANLKEEDFAIASSYKLESFKTGAGISYDINKKLKHSVDLDYVIKNYKITNQSTVSSTIKNSAGKNVSFILTNNFFYNTLNSIYIPKNGRLISYTNSLETPTSSSNGIFKNLVTFRNYNKIKKNIFSVQAKFGNIISLSDNDILPDDKFSLGGRWLRGFDSFGAGPRNSRTSYVGGNNLIVTKLDYSREITRNSDFPLFLNIFNDYGLLWENKTKPVNNDNSIRSSAGFGLKYYSPIGPIGFSWGFPIQDESYDIKRMFLFSVGNID